MCQWDGREANMKFCVCGPVLNYVRCDHCGANQRVCGHLPAVEVPDFDLPSAE